MRVLWINAAAEQGGDLQVESLVVLGPEHPAPRREQLELGTRGDETLAAVEHLDDVPRIRGDDGHPEQHPAVQVQVPGLGDGHLEPPPQLRDDGPHDRPLLLQ